MAQRNTCTPLHEGMHAKKGYAKRGHKGTVEIQAQHRLSRLKKPRTESIGTDRLGRVPSRLGPIGDAEKDIP